LIDLLNKAIGTINSKIIGTLNKVPGVTFGDIPTLPRLAAGGRAGAGRDYLVGESGPEILHMGSRSGHVSPNSALGGDTLVYITIDGQQLQARIDRVVRENNRGVKRRALAGAGAR
jgi:hypothetical protein